MDQHIYITCTYNNRRRFESCSFRFFCYLGERNRKIWRLPETTKHFWMRLWVVRPRDNLIRTEESLFIRINQEDRKGGSILIGNRLCPFPHWRSLNIPGKIHIRNRHSIFFDPMRTVVRHEQTLLFFQEEGIEIRRGGVPCIILAAHNWEWGRNGRRLTHCPWWYNWDVICI